MVKDEVVLGGHYLLLLVLNCNAFLDGNHAWNNLGMVYRRAWHKGLGNLAAQYMKWEAKTGFWNAGNVLFQIAPWFCPDACFRISGETFR